MNFYDKLFPPKVTVLPNGKSVSKKRSRMPIYILIVLALAALSVKITGFAPMVLVTGGHRFFDILKNMVPPKWSYVNSVWRPLIDTLKMSLLGSVTGSLLAIPFAVLASTNIVKCRPVVVVMRFIFSLVRTLPTLILALVATYILGLGTMAGTISIIIFAFGYLGKILYEEIETVNMGAFEAMESMGATKVKAFIAAIVPQVAPTYIANCLFCFEGNVRNAAILGYVGAGGIGLILNEKIAWREYDKVGMIVISLFIAVFVIENISRAIRRRLT